MHVSIHSLRKTLFDDEAVSLNCRTASGEVTILNHHRPLISTLQTGVITVIDKNNKKNYIPVSSGFLEVDSMNQIKLIVEE